MPVRPSRQVTGMVLMQPMMTRQVSFIMVSTLWACLDLAQLEHAYSAAKKTECNGCGSNGLWLSIPLAHLSKTKSTLSWYLLTQYEVLWDHGCSHKYPSVDDPLADECTFVVLCRILWWKMTHVWFYVLQPSDLYPNCDWLSVRGYFRLTLAVCIFVLWPEVFVYGWDGIGEISLQALAAQNSILKRLTDNSNEAIENEISQRIQVCCSESVHYPSCHLTHGKA